MWTLRSKRPVALLSLAASATLTACGLVTGIGDLEFIETGTSSTSGAGGAGDGGGTGAAGSTPTSGSSGGGSVSCTSGETQPCYSGAEGTEGIGPCVGGTQTCNEDGLGFGPCVGEVAPIPEDCTTAEDDDCDATPNQAAVGCVCDPGATQPCYSGAAGTEGVGVCTGGMQTCEADGKGWEPCAGDVVPTQELCATPGDDDCNGMTNEGGPDCVCAPGSVIGCYTGPLGTQGVGPCTDGTRTCAQDGLGHGPCVGEVVPVPETCNTPVDDDCNGQTNEGGVGCVCVPAATSPCYTGPASTIGIGICAGGIQTCDAQGTANSACAGETTPRPEDCTTAVDDNCDAIAPACTGTGVWSRIAGDSLSQQGNALAFDSSGNLIVTGQLIQSANLGGASIDSGSSTRTGVFTAKYGPAGAHKWSKEIGENAKDEYGLGVATDASDNGYFIGYYNGNAFDMGGGNLPGGGEQIFVAKLGSSGAHQWSRGFGDNADQRGHAIAVDPSGDVFVTGIFEGTLAFGGAACPSLASAGAHDIFVAKLDGTNGTCLWARGFGDPDNQSAFGLAVDGAGHAYVTGSFQGTLSFGVTSLTAAGGDDVFLAKLDRATGAEHWAHRFGDGAAQIGRSVAVRSNGTVAVTGQFQGSIDLGGGALASAGSDDVFLGELDANGAYQWQARFGDPSQQIGSSVAFDPAGNVMLTGSFQGTTVDFGGGYLANGGSDDVFLVKLDAAGNHLWSKSFGGTGAQRALAVAVDGIGNAAMTGPQAGSASYSGTLLTSAGTEDIFIAAFSP